MAIVDVRIRRSLKIREVKDSKGFIQTDGTLELLVISDTKDPAFDDILSNEATWANLAGIGGKIPKLGDEGSVNGRTLVCARRELEFEKDSDRVVVMTLSYEGRVEDEDGESPDGTDPTTWQRISIQTQQMTVPAVGYDDLAAAIDGAGGLRSPQNSAGDPVDGIEEEVVCVRLTYTNTAVLNPNFVKLNEYTNRCNSEDFLGGYGYSVRCTGWSGEYDQQNNTWTISVEFIYNPNGWQIEFYDVGFNEIVDGERKAILDKAGNPVSQPVPLDGNGSAAAIVDDSESEQPQPVELRLRYLYPYRAVDLRNIFTDCSI